MEYGQRSGTWHKSSRSRAEGEREAGRAEKRGHRRPPPASLHALAARLPRLPLGFVPLFPPASGDPARSEAPPGAAMRR